MNGIIDSIDRVGEENKQHVVMSDMNLDTSRFEEKNYPYKKLREKFIRIKFIRIKLIRIKNKVY